MPTSNSEVDITCLLQRFDRRSPDTLIRALAKEFVSLHRAHARLTARVAAMETLGAVADRLLTGAEAPFDYPKTLRIDAGGSTSELIGFHQLEYDDEGLPYRWTGPERQFSVQMFVSRRTPAAFELSFGKFFADSPVEQLRGFVDGEEVPLMIRFGAQGYEARGEMPPRQQAGCTVLTFLVPVMGSPAASGSTDRRALGLQFAGLSVTCGVEGVTPARRDARRVAFREPS